jgi:hypothetical protein
MWGGVAFSCPGRGAAWFALLRGAETHEGLTSLCAGRVGGADPNALRSIRGTLTCDHTRPYSTLPIFFTAAIRRALSSVTNFENSGASR